MKWVDTINIQRIIGPEIDPIRSRGRDASVSLPDQTPQTAEHVEQNSNLIQSNLSNLLKKIRGPENWVALVTLNLLAPRNSFL